MACREAADGGRICAATITFAASRPELHAPMFSECRLFGPVTGGEGPSISLPGFTSWACWMLGGGMADPAWPGWCMLLRLLRSRGVCCRGSSGGRAFVSALLFGLRRVVARERWRGSGAEASGRSHVSNSSRRRFNVERSSTSFRLLASGNNRTCGLHPFGPRSS